jgi:hypothetical protein
MTYKVQYFEAPIFDVVHPDRGTRWRAPNDFGITSKKSVFND